MGETGPPGVSVHKVWPALRYNQPVAQSSNQSEIQQAGRVFTLRQRVMIWIISNLVTGLIRLIGPTLRLQVEVEEGGPPELFVFPAIYAFWHRCIFPATWFFRDKQIAVMTSRSFDGEYIARIIEKMGFRAVRGSSSRGAVAALLGMHTELEAGRICAFTIDGPRGPRYVAKPGPVLLARNTNAPLFCFYLAVESAWVLNTWDALMIPKPFSRVALCLSGPVPIPRDGTGPELEHAHAEMQIGLERVRSRAEEMLHRAKAE